MTRSIRTAALPLLAGAAIVALSLAGCSPRISGAGGASGGPVQASPGITDTEINLGMTDPLSGPLALPGSQALAGLQSYIDKLNQAGGVKFGDGKTRTINLTSYDDGYDPARAVANMRQEIAEGKFANVGGLGTATGLATIPVANENKFPNVLLQSGGVGLSSNQVANPWTLGYLPTYVGETKAFGKYLASLGKPISVAVLTQDDDAGKAWSDGLKEGIKGSAVTIVDEQKFEVGDPQVDAQMAALAATKADVLFEATGQLNIIPQSMLKAQQLGWLPELFLPSVASNARQSIVPGNGKAFPAVFTVAFSKDPSSPVFANDPEVIQFKADFKKSAPAAMADTPIGQAVWGYQTGAVLEAAFKAMKEPTRQGFMDALHGFKGISIPLVLDGVTFDATSRTTSPMNANVAVEKFDFSQNTYVQTK